MSNLIDVARSYRGLSHQDAALLARVSLEWRKAT